MPSSRLETTSVGGSERVYLDTSAFKALSFIGIAKAVALNDDARLELSRAQLVQEFVARTNASLVFTPVVVEECANICRRKSFEAAIDKSPHSDWKAFQRRDARGCRTAQDSANKKALYQLKECISVAKGMGAILERWNGSGQSSTVDAESLRKAHALCMESNPTIDAMDAFHIVLAAKNGIKRFISFDRAWRDVASIDVFHE